ncbi:MAG: hypothetical protein ACLGI9_13140 [Thermoanaerobaculia bacterium]
MSKEGHSQAKVVDFHRWREEKGRRRHGALPEPPPKPEPPRFSGLLRAFSFMAGTAVVILCGWLGSVLWGVDEGRSCALLMLLPVGGAATFGLHLILWGVLGRPWARAFWTRAGSWLVRRIRSVPGFFAVTLLLVALTMSLLSPPRARGDAADGRQVLDDPLRGRRVA